MRLRRQRRMQHRKQKVFKRRGDFNPLVSLTDTEIWKRYRFSTATIMFIVNWIRPHTVSATRRSMALSPLIQVLLALRYYATGAYFSVIGDTLGVSKDATRMAVHRVSKALSAMGRGLVSFPTGRLASDVKKAFYSIAGIYKTPNYPQIFVRSFTHCVCGDHKRTDFRNAVFYHLVLLPTRCDVIAIR